MQYGVKGRRAAARTYVATREHETLGRLIKVGSSVDVDGRCRTLGARILHRDLRYRLERNLKELLEPWRVWPRDRRHPNWREDVFSAPSEWFYGWPEVLMLLDIYLARDRDLLNAYVRAKAGNSICSRYGLLP